MTSTGFGRLGMGVWALCLALGCGGKDDAGGEGDGTGDDTTGAGDSGTAGNTLGMEGGLDGTAGATMGGDSGDGGSGDADSGTTSTEPTEVFLSGEVTDYVLDAPIADAAISVWQLPGLETTADADGLWATGPFEPDQNVVFLVEPSAEYWGAAIPTAVGDEDDDNVRLAQISSMFVDQQIMLLEDQMPAEVDLEAAVMVVRLVNTTTLNDGAVDVTMTPTPEPGTFYAPDEGGAPILDSSTMSFTLLPVVVYFNLPETSPGDIAFQFQHPTRECSTSFAEFPTFGGFITLVDVLCE